MQSRRHYFEQASTLTDVLITIATALLLVALALPMLARSRRTSCRINCTNNLKQIGLAFKTWALDNNDLLPMQVSVTNGGSMELAAPGLAFPNFQVMSNELSTPKVLLCPEDNARVSATNFSSGFGDKNLSYFVSLNAVDGNGSVVLSGDRNLTNKLIPGTRFIALTTNLTLGWTKEMHSFKGNVCLADGSVGQFINGRLVAAPVASSKGTNCLVVP